MAKIKRFNSITGDPAPTEGTKPPRPRGRPHQGVIKEAIIGFRLNGKQLDAVKAAAKRFSMSPHEWCRKVILEKLFKQ